MEYAIARIDKVKSRNQLQKLHSHNSRSGYIAHNIDTERSHLNTYRKLNDLDTILERNNIKVRKNAVLALEYVVAVNDQTAERFNEDRSKLDAWFNDNLKFIAERHGAENIIEYTLHLDEKNPHAHITVVPIVEKEMKAGLKKRLDASYFVDGSRKLNQFQNDYAKAMQKHGLKRGTERVSENEKGELQREKRKRLTLKEHDQLFPIFVRLQKEFKKQRESLKALDFNLNKVSEGNQTLSTMNNELNELKNRLQEDLNLALAKNERLNKELLEALESDFDPDPRDDVEKENKALKSELVKLKEQNMGLNRLLDRYQPSSSYDHQ